ncbi:hypothetical protein MCEMSEM29_00361 [Methylophilaceae bacterium]
MTSKTKLIDHQQVAAIQQINLGYNAEQDRLLFRVGLSDNTELLVWLTSRITQLLWSLLTGEVHLPKADFIQAEMPLQQSVEQFKQEMLAADALQKMDFKTEYQPRPEVRNDGAMLALNAVLIHVENKQPSLELPCLEGVTVRINLNPDLTLAMCNMLQLATKEAGWVMNASIAAPVQSPKAIQMDQKKVLH